MALARSFDKLFVGVLMFKTRRKSIADTIDYYRCSGDITKALLKSFKDYFEKFLDLLYWPAGKLVKRTPLQRVLALEESYATLQIACPNCEYKGVAELNTDIRRRFRNISICVTFGFLGIFFPIILVIYHAFGTIIGAYCIFQIVFIALELNRKSKVICPKCKYLHVKRNYNNKF